MKMRLLGICALCGIVSISGETLVAQDMQGEVRNYLEQAGKTVGLEQVLPVDRSWVPYPAYADRAGWDALTGECREALIRRGEKYLDYEWKVVKATDYLEFERSGDREIMQRPYGANVNAMKDLVLAELAEGKGRFMDQIANGVYYFCEMTSWVSSAHLIVQKSRRPLPDDQEPIIDLSSGDLSSILAWTHYFLREELDKIHPLFADRLRRELKRRTIDPYLERDFHWSALGKKRGAFVNNWNPWCNSNVLQTFLLIEDDPVRLKQGVERTMLSVDRFLDYVKGDGACEEGPSYWGHAAGKLHDYLSVLSMATKGKINLFDKPLVRSMGEYIAYSNVGGGWVVNFADASAKGGGNPDLIYRYGCSVDSPLMKSYAAWLLSQERRKGTRLPAGDMFQRLEWFRSWNGLKQEKPALEHPPIVWYPETEFCYIYNKDNGFFFAAKGGHNNESHNHNDVGTFSLYADSEPVLIDVGVGTYTRQTFSSERYSIWTMQSNYHNLPVINGVAQKHGSKFRSRAASCDAKTGAFRLDIAGAYPDEAQVERWERACVLNKEGLSVTDSFALKEAKEPAVWHYMTWTEPDVSQPGQVKIGGKTGVVVMKYDAGNLEASVEKIDLKDKALKRVWGEAVYRLSLKEKKATREGSFTVTFQRAK